MNINSVFTHLPSRYQLEEFLLYLSFHPGSFPEVVELALNSPESKTAFRALWACEKVSQRWPEWWTQEQTLKIRQLVMTSSHTGMLRLGLSILYALRCADKNDVELLNKLYDLLLSASSPPGVQSQSMRLIYQMVNDNEDLISELWLVLEDASGDHPSAAFAAARKNLLKRRR